MKRSLTHFLPTQKHEAASRPFIALPLLQPSYTWKIWTVYKEKLLDRAQTSTLPGHNRCLLPPQSVSRAALPVGTRLVLGACMVTLRFIGRKRLPEAPVGKLVCSSFRLLSPTLNIHKTAGNIHQDDFSIR